MGGRRVVVLIGLPGSGKTSLASPLCSRFGLELIDRDTIRARLFLECAFTHAEKQAANLAVLETLRGKCAAGMSSLIDGMTFGRRAERLAVQAIAAEHAFRCVGLWLDCPVDVAVVRVKAQCHLAADRSPELVREVAQRFEIPEDAVRIDATLPMVEMIRLAEQALA